MSVAQRDNATLELSDLTRAERLVLLRRRRGQTQQEAAKLLWKVSYRTYVEWESGETIVPKDVAAVFTHPRRLLANEACFFARRRAGRTQRSVAEDLGCCRWHVVRMERGEKPCDELVGYWFS